MYLYFNIDKLCLIWEFNQLQFLELEAFFSNVVYHFKVCQWFNWLKKQYQLQFITQLYILSKYKYTTITVN